MPSRNNTFFDYQQTTAIFTQPSKIFADVAVINGILQ